MFVLSSWKYEPFIPDPDPESGPWFFTHPGSRIHESKLHRILDPGSGSATLRKSVKRPVGGEQETLEGWVGGSPERVLQVVTRAVVAPEQGTVNIWLTLSNPHIRKSVLYASLSHCTFKEGKKMLGIFLTKIPCYGDERNKSFHATWEYKFFNKLIVLENCSANFAKWRRITFVKICFFISLLFFSKNWRHCIQLYSIHWIQSIIATRCR
jgi:hypothetical protein